MHKKTALGQESAQHILFLANFASRLRHVDSHEQANCFSSPVNVDTTGELAFCASWAITDCSNYTAVIAPLPASKCTWMMAPIRYNFIPPR